MKRIVYVHAVLFVTAAYDSVFFFVNVLESYMSRGEIVEITIKDLHIYSISSLMHWNAPVCSIKLFVFNSKYHLWPKRLAKLFPVD